MLYFKSLEAAAISSTQTYFDKQDGLHSQYEYVTIPDWPPQTKMHKYDFNLIMQKQFRH